jgi:hypothetical protein
MVITCLLRQQAARESEDLVDEDDGDEALR